MTKAQRDLPALDDMLSSLLLVEEGEHEFTGADEVAEIRQLFFPVTRTCIYLNHAANGPLPRPVVTTMHEYIEDVSLYGGTHEERWRMHQDGAHRRLASMIGARSDQIAFTASTGDGLMLVAHGLSWHEGDEIVTAEGEFPTNVYPWLNMQEHGVHVHLVPARDGRIPTEEVCSSITERTRLVSLSLVEFSTGFRNDIGTIAHYCHERGVLCGIDAMQALGAIDIHAQELGVDFLAAASHKWLLSPRTTGILYVADTLLSQLRTPRRSWYSVETPFDFFNYEQPLKAGAARFEHSSSNLTAAVGLDAALGIFESIDGGMEAVEERILGLAEYAMNGLELIGYPVVTPRADSERAGIVCFRAHPERQDMTPQHIVNELEERAIFVAARGDVVRISPHFYNTSEEIDTLLNVLDILRKPDTL